MDMDEKRVYIDRIISLLEKKYMDKIHTSLDFCNPWELLVSTILSAQSTDASVNRATPKLFKRYRSVKAFSELLPSDIYRYTKRIGLYKSKSKNIVNSAKIIVKDFEGSIPQTIDELITLPGVGRKTANVVLYNAFGKSFGIAIDTHCITVSNRLKLSKTNNPLIIERELMRIVERRYWGDLTHLFIALGRDVCTSRKKYCGKCILNNVCLFSTLLQ